MTDQRMKEGGPDQGRANLPAEDAEFDRHLRALLAMPGDDDTAVLSRNVLSQLAREPKDAQAPMQAVLCEPLPWGVGFSVLLLTGGLLGYLWSAGFAGDEILTLIALGDPLSLIGGF